MKTKVLVCDVCEQQIEDVDSGVAIQIRFRQSVSPEGKPGARPQVAPQLSFDACPACTANVREQMSQQAHLEPV